MRSISVAQARANPSPATCRARTPGATLVELLVALAIGGVLCTLLTMVLITTQRFARSFGGRVAVAEALRVTTTILGAELRYLARDADLYGVASDSVALRVYRGMAIVCNIDGLGTIVRYRGIRGPDPAKDSVLVVGAGASARRALQVSGTTTGRCEEQADGESLYRWQLDPLPEVGTLILLFESGSYHLSGRALRYRRGESGRQPLTEELLDLDDGGLREVEPLGIELLLGVRAPLRASGPDQVRRVRYRLGVMNR